MNTSKQEYLSALLDDEAGAFERARLLTELKQDDELGQKLNRYALMGEAMRTKQGVVPSDSRDFLAGIQVALAAEPEYTEAVVQLADKAAARSKSWRHYAMGFGAAASVAMAALVGVWLLSSTDSMPSAEQTVNATATKATPATVRLQTARAGEAATERPLRRINLADSSRIRQDNQHMDHATRDALKQYVTLHMQHRANNSVITSIQASAYSQ